eukprot:4317302-Alexandrium_andersonii.AAC.1
MSASLVGSEMCIRDSTNMAVDALNALRGATAAASGGPPSSAQRRALSELQGLVADASNAPVPCPEEAA